MKIVKSPKYKCNKCRKTIEVEISELGDAEISSERRNMGNEVQYVWSYIGECSNCKNQIEITIEGYEYPVGFFNYSETNSEGCVIIEDAGLETEID